MAKYLDLANWARRDLFEFFRGFDKPYFNICTRIDVTNLLALLRLRSNVSVSLAYHYFALRVANEIEPFRYRLREGKVIVHDVIHGGTTVLLPNESFTFAYFNYQEDFEKFVLEAGRAVKQAQTGNDPFQADGSRRHDLLHGVALDIVHQLFPRSELGPRGFGTEDRIRQVHTGKRPHSFADFRRGTSRANGWTACGSIRDAPGRGAQKTGRLSGLASPIVLGNLMRDSELNTSPMSA